MTAQTLIVMRHAKSSWSDPTLADFDRPLNKRGRNSAKAIGEWLRFGGFLPDEVISSDARRAVETWEQSGLAGELRLTRALYLASPESMLSVARKARGRCVMIIGHNPGIGEFSASLLKEMPSHDRFQDYPTAATLVAHVPGPWKDLRFGAAELKAFTVPRDLTG